LRSRRSREQNYCAGRASPCRPRVVLRKGKRAEVREFLRDQSLTFGVGVDTILAKKAAYASFFQKSAAQID
jgi:hypothetical protein